MFDKPKRWKSKKYRDAAKDQPCTMRLPGCNNNPETTVLAHRNGAGMGMKADDYDAVDACYNCHTNIDARKIVVGELAWNRARLETIVNRIERGILK